MLGYAWQQGRMPLSHAALMRAIELNGVQVDNNKAAFEWGRRCAHDLASVQALFKAAQVIEFVKKPSLDEMVAKRVEFLTGYQDAAYAAQYKAFVDKVRAAEAPLGAGKALSEAVARYLFKLMAYKDEYEVARLHTDPAFIDKIDGDVRGRLQARAPPGAADRSRRSNDKGELVKQPFGPWMRSAFGVLARLKGLRGTRARPLRPHRGAQDRARADRASTATASTSCCATLDAANAAAGGRDRAHPRRDPRLRPREGAPPRRPRAPKWDAPDGAVARRRRAQGRLRRVPAGDWPALRAARGARRRGARALQRQRPARWARWPGRTCRRCAPGRSGCRSTTPAWRCRSQPDRLSAVLAQLNAALRATGLIRAWRDETFALFDPADGARLAHDRTRRGALLGHADAGRACQRLRRRRQRPARPTCGSRSARRPRPPTPACSTT